MKYKENDVVRWVFSENSKFRSDNRYWCKSQYAIFNKRGKFADTFWHGGDKFTFSPDSDEVELTYLGNLDDYRPVGSDVKRYYSDNDIMDISHSNDSKAIYLRKDAKKDASIMFRTIEDEIFEAQSEFDYHRNKIERLKRLKTEIMTAEDIEKIYI